MFDSVRKHQRILQFILLVLILPAFVFFGISGYQGMLDADRGVAKVGTAEIFQPEFDAAQRQQIERMRQMFGDSIDAKIFDTPDARARVLENLIIQKSLAQRAVSARVVVTDQLVQQTILGIEGLKRPDGSFDKARYEALVAAQGLTPAGFEALVRNDLQMQALPDVLQSSGMLPKSVLDRVLSLQAEQREVRWQRFPGADFSATVKPTEDALKSYYEAQGNRFDTPELTRVEFVVLSRDALAERVTLDPKTVREVYDRDSSRFGVPEQRRASHILIKSGSEAKAKAERLMAEIKADPTRFETLAKTQSDDPGSATQGGDLGFFDRAMMVKPFADAVFEMKEGEIRGPVESEFGLHLIRLTGIKPGSTRPFESVKAEIEKDLRQQQASNAFAEAAQQFTDMVYEQSESLRPVAQRWSLTVQQAQLTGRAPAADPTGQSPLANAKLVSALFGDEVLRNKRNTEAIDLGAGRIAAARVLDYRAPQRRPFEEVKEEVTRAVVAAEAARLAKAAGEARLAALKADPSGADKGFTAPKKVSRSATEGLSQRMIEAIFRMSSATVPAVIGVEDGEQGYTVVQILGVIPASAEAINKARTEAAAQIERSIAQQELNAYVDAVKASLKIVRHPERIGARAPTSP